MDGLVGLDTRYTILTIMRNLFIVPAFLSMVLPFSASAASFVLDPVKGSYGTGDTFIVTVRIDSDGDCLNAAQVTLDYPKDTLTAVDFSKGDSIFSLWIDEPVLDIENGKVIFAGGIPGGYCGRITGDPAPTDILGKVVFSVVGSKEKTVSVATGAESEAYLNDGLGTKILPTAAQATFSIGTSRVQPSNEWTDLVDEDTIAPDPFIIQVQSQKGVLGGKYFAVFSTIDKQSGLDHYDIYEDGGWSRIESPYVLKGPASQSLKIRAVDKAGNERISEYTPSDDRSTPVTTDIAPSLLSLIVLFIIFGILAMTHLYIERKKEEEAAASL